jgi:ribonuclease D
MNGVIPMAKKRTKKQAKARIPRLPTIPPVAVPLLGPLAGPYVIGKSAEIIADEFIDVDPLNRLASNDVQMTPPAGQTSVQRLASVVNDPAIVVDEALMAVINEPSMAMANNGEVMIRATPTRSRQFERQNVLPKKKRKKNPKLAAAFREANARYRTQGGKLRKGRTHSDIAKLAHRLVKKM